MKFGIVILLLCLYPAIVIAEVGSVVVGQYVATVFEGPGGIDFLKITREGKVLYRQEDYLRLRLGGPLEDSSIRFADGQDINGDGVPDLIVFGWSGGAHCCFTTWVFSLGAKFAVAAVIDGVHNEPHLRQMDNDADLEVEVRDWVFQYWPDSFAGSPNARVALDWDSGELKPSLELTEALQPSWDYLESEATGLRVLEGWGIKGHKPIGQVFQRALALLYAGRPELAELFIANSWGGDRQALAKYAIEFGRRLELSKYYRAIESERKKISR